MNAWRPRPRAQPKHRGARSTKRPFTTERSAFHPGPESAVLQQEPNTFAGTNLPTALFACRRAADHTFAPPRTIIRRFPISRITRLYHEAVATVLDDRFNVSLLARLGGDHKGGDKWYVNIGKGRVRTLDCTRPKSSNHGELFPDIRLLTEEASVVIPGTDNRHTACSHWVMGGVPLAAVANYVGHSTIQMTMRYSHPMPGVSQIASSVVDASYANAAQDTVPTDTIQAK